MLFPNPEAGPDQAQPETEVVPADITQADVEALFAEDQIDEQEMELSAPESEDEVEEEEPVQPNTGQQQAALVAEVTKAILQAQQSVKPAEVKASVVDRLLAEHPGADRDGLALLVKTVQTAMADNPVNDRISQIERLVVAQQQELTANRQQGILSDFDKHMDALLDNARIADPIEREMVYNTVIHRGSRKHGQEFSKEKATAIFRRLQSERTKSSHERSQRYVEGKEGKAKAQPPVRHASGGLSATESVMKRLTDPKDKSFNFNGQNFNRLLKGLVGGK